MQRQGAPAVITPATQKRNILRVLDPNGILGPLTADMLTADDLTRLIDQNLVMKRAYRDTLFDRHIYVAGSVVPSSQITFFSTPIGISRVVDNSAATSYVTSDIDTNLNSSANQLPKGEAFIVTSIQFLLMIPSAIDNTVSSGQVTDPTPKAASTPISPANTIRAILGSASIQTFLGSVFYETGTMLEFPPQYGVTGWAGTGTSLNNESLAQNGFGRCRYCQPYHVIDPGRRFGFYLNWRNLVTPNQLFYLYAMFDGIHLVSVQ